MSALPFGDLLIWDSEHKPPSTAGMIVLWRSFSCKTSSQLISIPRLIEENSVALRASYLAWVYELGELRLQGRRLIDLLELRPGLSYWWMSLLVEKCSYSKSPHVIDAIRLLAFIDWTAGHSFARITLVTPNLPLAECIRGWSENAGSVFVWRRLSKPKCQVSLKVHIFSALPLTAQALVWLLRYLLDRWPLRGAGLQSWRQTSATSTFVSYLFNLEPEAVEIGGYESRYWGNLPEILNDKNYKTNWLHLYLMDYLLPDARSAAKYIRELNNKSAGKAAHVTLDSFLSWRVVKEALRDWLKLIRISKDCHSIMEGAISICDINLWPLFVEDWRKSTYGITALSNSLFCNLFSAAFASLPRQRIGFYLQENQGWESALIQYWRLAGHDHLVGVPHSSVRFWDLRYFSDPRCYRKGNFNPMPLPDLVAVNGRLATRAYLAGSYPAKDLIQVEALRYLYLNNINIRDPAEASAGVRKNLHLLVLCDYMASSTRAQMCLLAQAADSLPAGTLITVKPHPACSVSANDYPDLQLNVTRQSLPDLIVTCDVVYTGPVTTAALDAYCSGVPVISFLDPNSLNMSPLRGYNDVNYVGNAYELAHVLAMQKYRGRSKSMPSDMFTLDQHLPRWLQLLYAYSD